MAEKCKPGDIYWRECDVYGVTWLSQKNVNKLAKHEFATMTLSQKDSLWSANTQNLR